MSALRSRVSELLTVLFLGLISAIATTTASPLIFFPELGALAFEVFKNPRGKWASSPFFLAFTPVVTGIIGVVIAMTMAYGFVSVLLSVALCITTVRLLGSPVAPAISAGVLPVVMGLDSWLYPPASFAVTSLLARTECS